MATPLQRNPGLRKCPPTRRRRENFPLALAWPFHVAWATGITGALRLPPFVGTASACCTLRGCTTQQPVLLRALAWVPVAVQQELLLSSIPAFTMLPVGWP